MIRWPTLLSTLAAATLLACGGGGPGEVCIAAGTTTDADDPEVLFNGTCVAEGELFSDSYDCDLVEGPCSSVRLGATIEVGDPDPERLDDPDLAWSTAQLASCSCICCHNEDGVSAHIWSWDYAPAWTDTISSERLETLMEYAGHRGDILQPEENNGFRRDIIGLPTNDPERMRAFAQRELARRGE
jgi:cytochrome c553